MECERHFWLISTQLESGRVPKKAIEARCFVAVDRQEGHLLGLVALTEKTHKGPYASNPTTLTAQVAGIE